MATNGGSIKFDVGFNVNKSSLNEITKALQEVQQAASKDNKMDQGFKQAADAAKQLERIVNGSWNDKLNQLNLNKFNQSVKESFGSVQNLKNQLTQGGAQGQAAFNSIASSVLNTNIQLRESNKLLDSMATSMANTVKWGITASIFNKVTGSIQSAYYYAKDLDSELTNIRMVTGAGADEMQRFAKNANSISKDLGRSTLDYTKAATEYYRQGLSDEEVAARTEVTLKAQNITGAGSEMIDYITAVLNGFQKTADETESTMDKLAAVADRSASDMAELATAMSKVAATANVMGVDVDQLNAQIATVVATTRLAPESVGTAFKIIYSRLNDIKTGADGAEISLGRYSSQMANLGFNVLDANGNLRDTGDVIEEIGYSWQNLTKEQQVYLASVMGGQRQITQVTALFDNWDKYVQMLNVSLEANGTLNEKNNIYLESTAAHLEQLGTEAERTFDILADTDSINGVVDVLNGALTIFNDFIDGLGGGANAFVYFGNVVAGIFNKQIAQAILQAETRFKDFIARRNIDKYKQDYAVGVAKQQGVDYFQTDQASVQNDAVIARARQEAQIYTETLKARQGLTQQQQKQLTLAQEEIGKLTQQKYMLQHIEDLREQYGVSHLTSLESLKAAEQSLQKQDNTLRSHISALSQIEKYLQQEEHSYQELSRYRQLIKQLEKDGIIDAAQRQTLYQRDEKAQELIQTLLQNQKLSYKDIHGQLQQITSLTQLQTKLDNHQLEIIDGKLVATKALKDNLKNTGQHVVSMQRAVKGISAAGQAITAWAGALPSLMDETATGAEKANAAFSGITGSISGALTLIPGIGPALSMAFSGVAGLIKAIFGDQIERWFMSAEEKIDELTNKIKETNQVISQNNKQIFNLTEVKEEWQTLSELAGKYGRNLNKMTDQQQARYHEIVNSMIQYNSEIVVGYDAQGQAIIRNNDELEKTIDLLKEQARVATLESLGDVNIFFDDLNTAMSAPFNEKDEREAKVKALEEHKQSNDEFVQDYLQLDQNTLDQLANRLQSFQEAYNNLLNNNFVQINTANGVKDTNFTDIINAYFGEDVLSTINNINIADLNTPEKIRQFSGLLSQVYEVINNQILGLGDNNILTANAASQLLGGENSIFAFAQEVLNQQTNDAEEVEQALEDARLAFEESLDAIENGVSYEQYASQIMAWIENSPAYNREWSKIATDENSGLLRQIVIDYISQFKKLGDDIPSNPDEYVANTGQALMQYTREYIKSLGDTFNNLNQQVSNAVKEAKLDDFQGSEEELKNKIKEIIENLLNNLGEGLEKYKDNPDLQNLLQIIIESWFDLNNIQINYDKGTVNNLETQSEALFSQIEETLKEKFTNLGVTNKPFGFNLSNVFDFDLKSITDNPQEVLDNLEALDWSKFVALTTQTAEHAAIDVQTAFTQIWNDFKFPELPTEALNFDTWMDPDAISSALKQGKKLTEEQGEYLNVLENTFPMLQKLNEEQGRGSEEYLNFLAKIREQSYQIYQKNIEQRREENEELLKEANLTIEKYEKSKKLNEEEQALLEEAYKNRTEAQNNLNDLKYEEYRVSKLLEEAEKTRAKQARERAISENEELISKIQGAKTLLQNLSKEDVKLGTDDLTTALYYESIDDTLANIVGHLGAAGRHTQEYRDRLKEVAETQQSVLQKTRKHTEQLIKQTRAEAEANLEANKTAQNTLKAEKRESQKMGLWTDEDQANFQAQMALLDKSIDESQDKIDQCDVSLAALGESFLDLGENVEETAAAFDVFKDSGNLLKTLSGNGELSQDQWKFIDSLTATNSKLRELIVTHGIYDQAVQKAIADEIKTKQELELENERLHDQELQNQKDKLQGALDSGILTATQAAAVQARINDLIQQQGKSKSEQIRLQEQIDGLVIDQVNSENEVANALQKQLKIQQQRASIIPNARSGLTELKKGSLQGNITDDMAQSMAYFEQHAAESGIILSQNIDKWSDAYINAYAQWIELNNNMTAQANEKQIEILNQKIADLQNKNATLTGDTPTDQLDPTISDQVLANEREIQQLQSQIISLQTQQNQVLTDRSQITKALVQDFQAMLDELASGKTLDPQEAIKFQSIIDYLLEQYPNLISDAELLKNTWMQGTTEYDQAIQNLVSHLRDLSVEQVSQQDYRSALKDIKVDLTLDNFDEVMEQLEDFIDMDRQITIEILADSQQAYNQITSEMDQIYNAASKIGEGYQVAASNIQDVVNAFGGQILQGYRVTTDGMIQLNGDVVQSAIATARGTITADAQATASKLQTAASELHAKADMYRQIAQKAGEAAAQEEQSANEAGQVIQGIQQAVTEVTNTESSNQATLVAQGFSSQQLSAQQASQSEVNNIQQVTEATNQAGQLMSTNFANAATSMATSIFNMAQSAIENFHQIAQANMGAMSKMIMGAAVAPGILGPHYAGNSAINVTIEEPTAIESSFTGQLGTQEDKVKQAVEDAKAAAENGQGLKQAYEKIQQQALAMAESLDAAGDSLDAKAAEILGNSAAAVNELGDAASGRPSNKGGRGGGDGGGGGKEDQKEELDDLEDKIDRYHDIDLEIKRIDDDLKALQEAEDGLEGAELEANLNQQLALLDEQNAAYERKLELMRQEQAELQAVLAEEGAVFDADGYLTNYRELLDAKQAAIEYQMQVYETLNGEEAKIQKQTIDEMKRLYDEFLQTLSAYEDLAFSSIPAVQSEIQSNQATAIKINKKKSGDSKKSKSSGGSRGSSGGSEKDITDELIEQFKFKVELELDMAKAERDYNKFRKQVVDKVRDDAIPKLNEYIFKDLSSYYRSGDGTGSVGALTQHVTKTLDELKAIDSKGVSSVYGAQRTKAMEDLVSYLNELMGNLEDAQKLIDEIKDSIFDTIDQVNDNLEKQVNLYEHISDLISHDVKVVELLYGKDAFDSLDKYYKMQQKNDNLQLDLLRQQRDLWYDRMVAEQNRMNSLQPNTNAWKEAQDRLEEYKNNWMDATKELNSLLENAINNIIDKYSNAIEKVFDKLEKGWTNGRGLDYVQEEWELINKEADNYLDKINSIYEIQKLEDTFKNAINDNMNDLKAQQALNKLMDEQLKFLRDKDKLTQYDVDRANLLLQIEIKRLALENSRQNKTKLRLRRDSQGNYTYQYTADQDEVSKIQQELNELQNSLFNLTNDSYKSGLDSLYSMISEYENKLKDVYLDTTLTAEEQQRQIALYNEYYGKIINDLIAQNEDTKKYLFADTFNTLAQYYENDLKNYQDLTDKQKALANSTLNYFISQSPKYNQNFKNLTDTQKEQAAALFAYLGQAYGIDVTNFGNMTALEKKQANSLFKALNDYYGQNEHNFQNMISTNAAQFTSLSDAEKSILEDQIVPQWDSSLQEMIDKFSQPNVGLVDIFKDGWNELSKAVKQYEIDLQLLAESGTENFEKLKMGQDDNIKATQSLIQSNKDLIETQKGLLTGTDDLLKELADVEDAYEKQKQSAIQAAEAANAYITSVENLGSALRALPYEKTIHINYDSSGGGSSVPAALDVTGDAASPRSSIKFPQYKSDGDYTKDSVGGIDLMSQSQSDSIRDYYADKKNLANAKAAASNYQYSYSTAGTQSWEDLSYWQQDREGWKQLHGFATGGYTGSWGTEGKLAFVHEKELILNAQDTENILSAVDIVRQMNGLLANLDPGIGIPGIKTGTITQANNNLDQNVHITATFPNVSDHSEIERALDSLVNRASQFAFKK